MTNRRNLLAAADARARLSEVRRTTEPTSRRQRPALDREARRLGWRSTKAKAQ